MEAQVFREQEKISTTVFHSSVQSSIYVAAQIRNAILENTWISNRLRLNILGSTPIRLYQELVKMHQEGLSFRNVYTFNLDEYYPMEKSKMQSYHHFMHDNLFDHVDIPKQNIHIPDGQVPFDEIPQFCQYYEQQIELLGGIDIQILGIGKTGHIGFNEPGSLQTSITRLVYLDKITRQDAASDFYGLKNVPIMAITMGIQTILKARKIFILAFSESKAQIVKQSVEGEFKIKVPSTILQNHKDCTFVLDKSSSEELTRYKCPWTLKGDLSKYLDFNDRNLRLRAVIWLSNHVKKSISRLTDDDYYENSLQLLIQNQNVEIINKNILNELRSKITQFPAGQTKKRVVIFSPHPDDDVICMGATMRKLVDQGHEVHVVYQTSGNSSVFDHDAQKFAYFLTQAAIAFKFTNLEQIQQLEKNINEEIKSFQTGDIASQNILQIKSLIRNSEALIAAMLCGLERKNIHYLNLPFYETGKIKKNPLGQIDVDIVKDIILKIDPQQIYLAGDMTDPHGTHRICAYSIQKAIQIIEKENEMFMRNCEIFLYRGAWQEWEIDTVTMAVPVSIKELHDKKQAIFRHESQKDTPLFPGTDSREFWQRSEFRNRQTAQKYTDLGLECHEAMEVFVQISNIAQIDQL